MRLLASEITTFKVIRPRWTDYSEFDGSVLLLHVSPKLLVRFYNELLCMGLSYSGRRCGDRLSKASTIILDLCAEDPVSQSFLLNGFCPQYVGWDRGDEDSIAEGLAGSYIRISDMREPAQHVVIVAVTDKLLLPAYSS